MRKHFRLFLTFVFFFSAVLLPPSFAAKRGPIIIGAGAGYSFFLDSGLRSYEIYHPRLIYFSEQLDLKHNINCYAQYFPWLGFGFQFEFDHQEGGYRSDWKWYGYCKPDGEIIEIDHIEEPFKENWSLSSLAVSVLYVLNLRRHEKVRPYISAGVGYYFSSGDKELFFDRSRLGPKKSGNLIKLGLGVKCQITPDIGLNIRGVGSTIWRREYGYGEILYMGPDQFDIDIYMGTGQLVRQGSLIAGSFTFLGVVLSLEYTI